MVQLIIDDFRACSIVPIPKAKNINITVSENYRGIALSSVFGRIFDLIVLHRYSDYLISCDLQFGFRKNRSTAMCSMIAKEVIAHYVNLFQTTKGPQLGQQVAAQLNKRTGLT